MNENGIEVISLLISNEAGGSNITTTRSIADLNGYQIAGLDAINGGQNLRDGFAFFRGVPITSWPVSDRRRLVVINAAADSPSHQQWEILYNELAPTYPDAVTAINEVLAPAPGVSFAAWALTHPFSSGQGDPTGDPDGDGMSNLHEFVANTDPLDPASRSLGEIAHLDGATTLTYRRARNRSGVTHRLQVGSLDSFNDFTPTSETVTDLGDDLDEITVTLPAGSSGFVRQVATLTP